jgi:hypothetical protein
MAAATDPMQQFLVTVNQTTGAIQGYSQRIDETRKAMEEGTVSTEDATKAIAEYEQSVQEAVAKALPELQKLLDVLKAIGQQHPRLNLDTSGVGSAMVDLKNAIGGNGAGTPGGIGSPAMATGPAAGGLPAALGGAKPCLCTCTEGGAGAAPGIGGQPGAGGQGAAGGQPAAAAQVGAGPAVAQSPSQFTALMSSWKSFGSQVEQFGTATMENFAKASNRWKP